MMMTFNVRRSDTFTRLAPQRPDPIQMRAALILSGYGGTA
jgi:hypothetical protein